MGMNSSGGTSAALGCGPAARAPRRPSTAPDAQAVLAAGSGTSIVPVSIARAQIARPASAVRRLLSSPALVVADDAVLRRPSPGTSRRRRAAAASRSPRRAPGTRPTPTLASIASPSPATSNGSASARASSARRSRAPARRRVAVDERSRTRRRRAGRRCRLARSPRAAARADLEQELVARVVAERVVDLLEPVEVHEHDRRAVAAAFRGAERDLGPVAEHHPVGQVGERVVEREALADDGLTAGAVDRDQRQDQRAAARQGCSRWRAPQAARCRAEATRSRSGTRGRTLNCRRSGVPVWSEMTIATAAMLKP